MPRNSIPRRVLTMRDLINKKNVQHNDLITSVAKMDKLPLKIFEFAASFIDPNSPPENNEIYLSKSDLFMFFNVSDSNKHSRFKQVIENMQKQSYFVMNRKSNEGLDFESIVPITYVKWDDHSDEVIIEFNRHIMPYLLQINQDFTQYAISDILELNSKYSIILYKWLSMHYNQYDYYKSKGNRTNRQLELLKNPVVTVKELRRITDTMNEYPRFTNFESYVVKNALKEISEYTHFEVTYEKYKKGRSIESIKFFVDEKQKAPNAYYKEEQQDPAFLEEQKNGEEETESLYMASVESNYTTLLEEYGMITFKNIQDKELMAGLQQKVYSLYDKLEQIKGMGSVDKHVSYVASRKKDYSKKNIVRYLHESIKNYLARADLR